MIGILVWGLRRPDLVQASEERRKGILRSRDILICFQFRALRDFVYYGMLFGAYDLQ
jgi:hypothetical protein